MIAGILFADPVLYPEELVAVLDALDRRLAVVKLFSLRYCIYEVPADMSLSLESIKEFCCVIAVSGRGVSEQEDRRKAVFSAAEHPHE